MEDIRKRGAGRGAGRMRDMKKIGFIDYRLDEWHANNYPAWIRQANEKLGTDYKVAYGWAEEAAPSGLRSTAAWCEAFGAEPCQTLEELCEKSDVLMILAPSNPEKHLGYAERALKYGKLTYIDKTFAPDAATARRIFELSARYGARIFSTSALRYAEELKDFDRVHSAFVMGSGSSLEEYCIHQIEMIVCLMGIGAQSVVCSGSAEHAVCHIAYAEGRSAELIYGAAMPYALDVQRAANQPSEYVPVKSAFFPNLLADILAFYETGREPVPQAQTMECMKLREAVVRASSEPGTRVAV